MQPVKITIAGDYFDCQIYRGRLYLWTFDGELKVYNWNDIVDSFIKKETDRIALTFCFKDGNYLYKSSLIELFKDEDFRKLLLEKFEAVMHAEYRLSEKTLEKFLFGVQDTPTGIIPTDTEIYSNKLYFITEEGLFSGSAHRNKSERFPVSSRPKKLWDCHILSLKANKYPQLALSAGDEGLFELNMANNKPTNLKRVENSQPIFQISKSHSSFSNYSYLNIYSTSLIDSSFLAMFKWDERKDKNNKDFYLRNFDETVQDKALFEVTNDRHFLSWGIEDKIYKVTSRGFDIIRYNNRATEENGQERFINLKSVNLQQWKGNVISGGTAYFGNIIECDNALVILKSDKNFFTIPGPITRWRAYPRSMNYENHLHVILQDRIEIYSFNHDYFLNQENKEIGIEFKAEKHRRRFRTSYFDTSEEFDENDLPF